MSDGAPSPGTPRIERRYWERRVVLLLIPAAIGAALLVGLLLGVGRDSGAQDEGADRGAPIGVALPTLERAARVDDASLAVRVPEGWRQPRLDGGVRLRSPSGGVELVVVAAADAGLRGLVLEQAGDEVRTAFSDVEVVERRPRGRVAGRQARRVVLEATNPRGTRLRILLAAVSGPDHTYLIEAVNVTGAPRSELVELQLALNSLELG